MTPPQFTDAKHQIKATIEIRDKKEIETTTVIEAFRRAMKNTK